MSRDEYLDALRDLELRLRRPEMIQFIGQQPTDLRTRFSADLTTLSVAIGTIENAQLAEISARLDALDSDIKSGLQDLQHSIDAVTKTVAVLTEIGAVVGMAVKVAGLI